MQEERIEILVEGYDDKDKDLRHILSIALDKYCSLCASGRKKLHEFIWDISWMFTVNNRDTHSIEFKHVDVIKGCDYYTYSPTNNTYYYKLVFNDIPIYLKYSNKHKYPVQVLFNELPSGDLSCIYKEYAQVKVGNNYYPPVTMYENLKKSYIYTYPYIPKHNEKYSKVGYVEIEEALKFPLISFLDFNHLDGFQ